MILWRFIRATPFTLFSPCYEKNIAGSRKLHAVCPCSFCKTYAKYCRVVLDFVKNVLGKQVKHLYYGAMDWDILSLRWLEKSLMILEISLEQLQVLLNELFRFGYLFVRKLRDSNVIVILPALLLASSVVGRRQQKVDEWVIQANGSSVTNCRLAGRLLANEDGWSLITMWVLLTSIKERPWPREFDTNTVMPTASASDLTWEQISAKN